jgi:hypothetical protein
MIMRKICKECANYDHKNLKHTKACGNCVTEHYEDGTESDPSNWRALPQTNADRIRVMSDEKLYDLFREIYNAGCDDATAWEWGTRQNTFIWDEEWLKQPAEVDHGQA